jgi:hypothetical protein
MNRQEIVYRYVACGYIDGRKKFTQLEISNALRLSLSTVNGAVKNLEEINAVRINMRSFEVISLERLLLYWATKRKFAKDIAYQTRVDAPVREIERGMPEDIAFTCYTAYKLIFNDVPADYSEVYAYATEDSLNEIKRRFAKVDGPSNLVVLSSDENMEGMIKNKLLEHSSVCKAQLFADLWNIKAWYARDFVEALEKKLGI